MKKLILLAVMSAMMVGCNKSELNADGTYSPGKSQKVYVVDSCEYVGKLDEGKWNYLAHKGNCRFCAERRQKELEELVKQLKSE